MKLLNADDWIPADGLVLEKNALDVIKLPNNTLVLAGPGAGKTELLAQKACYLLQTNICKYPHKILAISFKKDAAYNLKERVKLRCDDDLSSRFDSLTFDSFAKQILDRFRQALPKEFNFSGDYEVMLDEKSLLDYYRVEDPGYVNAYSKEAIMNFHTSAKLPLLRNSEHQKFRYSVWTTLLKGQNPKLTFRMIMRLAELIITANPKVKKYLQETYHYVFLDEFQDTTEIQYDFFKNCFLNSKSLFTAVGDDKQRIMSWAGAKDSIFDEFITETIAKKIPLTMNFRCAPRLVSLQNHLIQHLLGKTDFATASPKWQANQGECFVWTFENPTIEMQSLFTSISNWINRDGVDPRDICILVKQKLSVYVGSLIEYFNVNGIKARDENKFQDLLTQEVSLYIIHTIYVLFDKRNGESKKACISFLRNLHTELEDDQLLKLEIDFDVFIKRIRKEYGGVLTEEQIKKIIFEIVEYANKDRIKAVYASYKNGNLLDHYILGLQNEFIESFISTNNIILALDKLIGKDTIPVMTVHKSKGLEYHTVVFIGLEDGAFWTFAKQPDEDKCAFFVALSRAKERVVFTFSKHRKVWDKMEPQTFTKIKVIFDELKKSNIVVIEDKK